MAGCASFLSGDDEDDFRVPLVCDPSHERVPCGARAQAGVAYRFNLLTHCGIEWAYFDGRYWVPPRKVDPPSNWANIEPGTMTLTAQDEAVFAADVGGGARFEPAPLDFEPEPCA
jgi:hypothetical protein